MNISIKKDADWWEANQFLHGLANVLEEDEALKLMEFVQALPWTKENAQPMPLVRKVFEFLSTRDDGRRVRVSGEIDE